MTEKTQIGRLMHFFGVIHILRGSWWSHRDGVERAYVTFEAGYFRSLKFPGPISPVPVEFLGQIVRRG